MEKQITKMILELMLLSIAVFGGALILLPMCQSARPPVNLYNITKDCFQETKDRFFYEGTHPEDPKTEETDDAQKPGTSKSSDPTSAKKKTCWKI